MSGHDLTATISSHETTAPTMTSGRPGPDRRRGGRRRVAERTDRADHGTGQHTDDRPDDDRDRRLEHRERDHATAADTPAPEQRRDGRVVAAEPDRADRGEAEQQRDGRSRQQREPTGRQLGAGLLVAKDAVRGGELHPVPPAREVVVGLRAARQVPTDAEIAYAVEIDRRDPGVLALELRQRVELGGRRRAVGDEQRRVVAGIERAAEQQRIGEHRPADDHETQGRLQIRRAVADDDHLAVGRRTRGREATGGDPYAGAKVVGRAEKVVGARPVGQPVEEHLGPRRRGRERRQLCSGRVVHRGELRRRNRNAGDGGEQAAVTRIELRHAVRHGTGGDRVRARLGQDGKSGGQRDADGNEQPAERPVAQPGQGECRDRCQRTLPNR